MTNPGTFVPSEGQDALDTGAGLSFDDIAAQAGAPDPVAPTPVDTSIKLNGDNIPEEYRGLTLDQMIQRAEGQKEVIKRFGSRLAEPAPAPAPPPPAAPPARPAVPQMTQEQFEAMYEESPTKAVASLAAIVKAQLEDSFEQRLSGLVGSVAGTAKTQAMAKYADEFKVLGTEIENIASQVPDKSALSRPEAWDSLVAMAKGIHADKWVEHKLASRQGNPAPAADPRTAAAAASLDSLPAPRPAPAQPRTEGSRGAGGYRGELPADAYEVMKVMNIDEATYRKHYV